MLMQNCHTISELKSKKNDFIPSIDVIYATTTSQLLKQANNKRQRIYQCKLVSHFDTDRTCDKWLIPAI